MPSNSLPDADLNLPEMKTKSHVQQERFTCMYKGLLFNTIIAENQLYSTKFVVTVAW